MSTRAVKGDNAYLGVLLVEQQPVGVDVALPVALVVAVQQVIVVLRRQSLAFAQHVNDREELLHVECSVNGQFHISVILLIGLDVVLLIHRASIAFLKSSNDS